MKILDKFKEDYPDYKVIYLTITGSKLYGTDTPTSDTDYKGIFVPPTSSLLTKTDIDHYTFTTGSSITKNSADDIDIQLWSIHKFLNLIAKGETGALDLLFSMMREDTQLLTTEASAFIKEAVPQLLHKSVHSFIGYCIGQSRKYNIKGERYNELITFIDSCKETELSIKALTTAQDYNYISIVHAPGPRGNKGDKDIPYISVLGKLFDITLPREYIIERLQLLEASYGNRAKSARSSVDYKALSHAVRVILEVKELLCDKVITFPLKKASLIKKIKAGEVPLEEVMEYIAVNIAVVDRLLEASTLPDKLDPAVLKELLLTILSNEG